MKKYIILLSVVFLVSCGSVPLTPEGQRVRRIQADWSNKCKFISSEEIQSSNGYSPENCHDKAYYLMLNRVAEMGGNAYLLNKESVSTCLMGGTILTFEVYNCSLASTESKSNVEPIRDDLTTLEALKSMNDRGVISDEEFSRKKKEILERM